MEETMSEIQVGDRFEWLGADATCPKVWEVHAVADGGVYIKDVSGRLKDRPRYETYELTQTKHWRRLPPEPSKVEPRAGQVWRCQKPRGEMWSEWRMTGSESGVCIAGNSMVVAGTSCEVLNTKMNPERWTLISDPSPTKEAEVVINVKTDGSFGGGTVTFKPACDDRTTSAWAAPAMTEAEICAATEKRNAEYQLEQAEAIKKRWLEQQSNPHQYLAYGVVTAGGWQQRGSGRK
jgi:hypothetical protein